MWSYALFVGLLESLAGLLVDVFIDMDVFVVLGQMTGPSMTAHGCTCPWMKMT